MRGWRSLTLTLISRENIELTLHVEGCSVGLLSAVKSVGKGAVGISGELTALACRKACVESEISWWSIVLVKGGDSVALTCCKKPRNISNQP